MKDPEAADEPPLPRNNLSWARTSAHVSNLNLSGDAGATDPDSTLNNSISTSDWTRVGSTGLSATTTQDDTISARGPVTAQDAHRTNKPNSAAQTAPVVAEKGDGEESTTIEDKVKLPVGTRFLNDIRQIILSSWINWLLIFAPIGIAFGIMTKVMGEASPISPNIVFAMNAIAIIPLAYLLCYATESVAAKLGDTMGALLNVTFGNAVELIIFVIALVAKEIRIVQASLLGSILANLLLILGMCFLFGGLRFREQVNWCPTLIAGCS
jgi:Ca2+:H+ antiporter